MANTKKAPAEQKQRDITATVLREGENGPAYGLVLKFSHGPTLELHVSTLEPIIRAEATVHGLKQKLVDAAAIARDTKTGRSATIQEKYAAVNTVYDRLLSGAWNEEREGGGASSYLFKALCEMKPSTDPVKLREWLDGRTKEEKAGLEANPKISAIINRMKAEAAAEKAKGVDSEALLADMPE